MPANSPIVIADGASTPVNHTFSPNSIDGNIAAFKERVTGVPIGYPELTVSMRDPGKGSQVYKGQLKLVLPTVVTSTDASGKVVTTTDYTCSASAEFLLPIKSTQQNRTDIVKMLANALNEANIKKVLIDLERFW